jgi:hypothetical protein
MLDLFLGTTFESSFPKLGDHLLAFYQDLSGTRLIESCPATLPAIVAGNHQARHSTRVRACDLGATPSRGEKRLGISQSACLIARPAIAADRIDSIQEAMMPWRGGLDIYIESMATTTMCRCLHSNVVSELKTQHYNTLA